MSFVKGLVFVSLLVGFTACKDTDDEASPSEAEPTEVATTQTVPPTMTPSATPTEPATPTELSSRSTLKLQGLVPSDGAMAVPRFPNIQVAFSQALPLGAEASVSGYLEGPDGQIDLIVDTDSDEDEDSYVAMLPSAALQLDTIYTLHVTVDAIEGWEPEEGAWPITETSAFSTEVPCGVTFNIGTEITIHTLGGNERLVALLQEILDASTLAPIALMFVDTPISSDFPQEDVTLVSGLPTRDGDVYSPDPLYGYPVSVDDCLIEVDGAWSCEETRFIFPIPITPDTIIYLTISKAVLSGQNQESGAFEVLEDFSIEGVITEEDLIITLEAAGLPQLVEYIELDVDTDQDGEPDSASASASSHPVWLNMDQCDVGSVP